MSIASVQAPSRKEPRQASAAPAVRRAGSLTLVAVATLMLPGTASLFFGGAGELLGPTNDVLTSVTLLPVIPVVVAVRRLTQDTVGPWFHG